MKKLIYTTLILGILNQPTFSNSNYGLRTTLETALGTHYKNPENNREMEENPITLALEADSYGDLEIVDVDWVYFTKKYPPEEFGGVSIELSLLGAKYEKIHRAIGNEFSYQYADIAIEKAFMLNDGVTLILTGRAKVNSSSSLNSFPGSEEHSKLYNKDKIQLDIEMTGEIRFKVNEADIRGFAYYDQYSKRNFESADNSIDYSFSKQEFGLGVEYKPSEKSNHTFGLHLSRVKFVDDLNQRTSIIEENQIRLTYKYKFDLNEFLFGSSYGEGTVSGNYDDIVDELDLPDFY